MDELDQVLQELRGQGALDSAGVFTLDWRHALGKLRSFQLPDRCYFALKWVQSAVAAGATRCEVRSSPRALSLAHDGTTLTSDQLQSFFTCLLDESGDQPAWSELAIGVNSVLGFPGSEVVLESGGQILYLSADRAELRQGGSRETRITARRALGWGSWLKRQLPESLLLKEKARFAPMKLTVDGEVIEPWFGEESGASRWQLSWPGKYLTYTVLSHSRGLQQTFAIRRCHLAWELRDVEGPGAGQFRLGAPRSAQQDPLSHIDTAYGAAGGLYVDPILPAQLHLIRRGVLIQTLTGWTGLIAGEVMLGADDLPTDLTGFSIRGSRELSRRREWAEGFARRLRAGFERAYPHPQLEEGLIQAAARNRLARRHG
ncbi:hypothetical protein DYH09_11185 [bacterium CPR1]|nr:hypothetical protein [bacterium CPR1]